MFIKEKCALRFFLILKASGLTPQYSILPILPPPSVMTSLYSFVSASTCACEMSWRARNTCS